MGEGGGWAAMRERRLAEPGAAEAYEAARLAFELGRSVRELRERRGWSQTQLATASGMTQSAVARFEAGGTVPTLVVLERLATALEVSLKVGFEPATPPRSKAAGWSGSWGEADGGGEAGQVGGGTGP
ncbi:helix-turn-helix transcriptional regulator [Solwaraspora sp. WMMA2056]|uniref:helix-turn-helix domain-containing protein n=1 Tax=Solwaraspora sp. WMMA2056 TaxID=3015161 RepID=UPI00259B27FA|nr:helix-turn-helix transcriptional regulator [Solwaraspora sp. WMMA2056]WJK42636.1 helix-turn-helix transcriptional regulator [Solwaraspora sp. WMMA2056]